MNGLTEVSSHKCFGGYQKFFTHESSECKAKMPFSVYIPKQAEKGKCPCLIFLAGLRANEQNAAIKSGFQRLAAQYGMIVACPDTSPRGLNIEGAEDTWEFGIGAGFYIDATEEKWRKHFRMYSYITEEFLDLLVKHFNVNQEKVGITGHSMGGHGAMIFGLKNPHLFKSISAFAPICNPSISPWGVRAFKGYLGNDVNAWKEYDTCELVPLYNGPPREIFLSQGTNDPWTPDKQLLPENLVEVCKGSNNVTLNMDIREGHDHSYFFVASCMEDHIKFHIQQME
ncbi:S-formylglutathione hydrolase-like [Lytechinus variegatus]|uniref:S-formylglutathione hydrolase-like n=1 Tax=Lytechinus variegatus TaxID=7654 RepID=UPI001BB1C9ED|nr:S-formylglutathione hydrolase-like [Lytechinus variegatus]XP_041483636.1 S-formylglutathione hydrolase-like [Lytechinus variegatus]